jgi:hypothetical protein
MTRDALERSQAECCNDPVAERIAARMRCRSDTVQREGGIHAQGIFPGLVIASAALVGGCATAHQKQGLTAGFDDQQLDGGRWRVRYGGNGYSTYARPDLLAEQLRGACDRQGAAAFRILSLLSWKTD